MYLSIDSESPEKFTFEAVYKRFLTFDKINQRRQKRKERSDPFGSESESDSELDTDVPKKKFRQLQSTTRMSPSRPPPTMNQSKGRGCRTSASIGRIHTRLSKSLRSC